MGVLVRCGAMAAWLVVTGMAGVGVGYLLAVFVMGARLTRMDREVIEQYARPQHGDQAILERVLDRLLSAVVPEPVGTCIAWMLGLDDQRMECSLPSGHPGRHKAADGAEWWTDPQHSDAEYVPPDDDWTGAMDWTDPLLGGVERPMVGRLAPGQGIPGIPVQDGQVDPVEKWREMGEGAFDEWARETVAGQGEDLEREWNAWVDPVEEV